MLIIDILDFRNGKKTVSVNSPLGKNWDPTFPDPGFPGILYDVMSVQRLHAGVQHKFGGKRDGA